VNPIFAVAVVTAAAAWVAVLLWSAKPWSTRERIAAASPSAGPGRLTVLIPARNEAAMIGTCLRSVLAQGPAVSAIVVDDRSTDNTVACVQAFDRDRVKLVTGQPLPDGWTGKLWALEQGIRRVRTDRVLLLDADIVLGPGMLAALAGHLERDRLGMLSVMARLRSKTFWERLLMPAYVYFFKLLYPFAWVNSTRHARAAAAGGCVLLRIEALDGIGGFESLRGALIDDCTLAQRVKQHGWPIRIVLSGGVGSLRVYARFADVLKLVSRTAYTQLHYSPALLLACTVAMLTLFVVPVAAMVSAPPALATAGLIAYAAMALSFLPTLRFYELHGLRALLLPLVATTYLLMTWYSALQYWQGAGAVWKARRYDRSMSSASQGQPR